MVPDLGRWCTAPSRQPGRLRDLRFAILGNGGHVFLASGEMSAPRAGNRCCTGGLLVAPGSAFALGSVVPERRTKGGSMQREMSFRRGLGVLAAVLMLAGVAPAYAQ